MKATEDSLNGLHGALAEVLTAQVKEVGIEEDEDGSETKVFTATPALLTVALNMLKNNNITCEVGESTGLTGLKEELANRKKRSSLALVAPISEDVLEQVGG